MVEVRRPNGGPTCWALWHYPAPDHKQRQAVQFIEGDMFKREPVVAWLTVRAHSMMAGTDAQTVKDAKSEWVKELVAEKDKARSKATGVGQVVPATAPLEVGGGEAPQEVVVEPLKRGKKRKKTQVEAPQEGEAPKDVAEVVAPEAVVSQPKVRTKGRKSKREKKFRRVRNAVRLGEGHVGEEEAVAPQEEAQGKTRKRKRARKGKGRETEPALAAEEGEWAGAEGEKRRRIPWLETSASAPSAPAEESPKAVSPAEESSQLAPPPPATLSPPKAALPKLQPPPPRIIQLGPEAIRRVKALGGTESETEVVAPAVVPDTEPVGAHTDAAPAKV